MRVHRSVSLVVALFAVALLTSAAQAADATGTWKWTQAARGGGGGAGGQPREITLKLKQEGDKLTGTIAMPAGRGGGGGGAAAPAETPIEAGMVKGDEISFTVTREFQGNKFVSKYSGKVDGDTIKGKVESERGGQTQSRDWEAKRAK